MIVFHTHNELGREMKSTSESYANTDPCPYPISFNNEHKTTKDKQKQKGNREGGITTNHGSEKDHQFV